jgi:hypothetical protein
LSVKVDLISLNIDIRKVVYNSKVLPKSVAVGHGMTSNQYADLVKDYDELVVDGIETAEPLGFGVSWLYWLPPWTEENGSHAFFIPMQIHDLTLVTGELQDGFLAEQCIALARFHESIQLRLLNWLFSLMVKIYRIMK